MAYWKGKIVPNVSNKIISQIDILNSLSKIVGSDYQSSDGKDLSELILNNEGE